MHRFFVSPDILEAEEVPLPREVVQHLGTVLRLAVGSEVLLLDGLGAVARCRLEALSRNSGLARVLERHREHDSAFPITLMQALPKGDKLELVLQKGTELGVTAFLPVLSSRCVARGEKGKGEGRRQRWERIIGEAARQSQRPCLPRLGELQPLQGAVNACTEPLRLMLWEEGSRPLAEVLPADRPSGAAVLIGPEGGFSVEEAQMAANGGFIPVHLGPRILRTETAGFAVAGILQYVYGDLGNRPRSHVP